MVLTDLKENTDNVLKSVIQLFRRNHQKLNEPGIEICHIVNGPEDWKLLPRSAKDQYPQCKHELAIMREKMDELLRSLRASGIKASKQLVVGKPAGNVFGIDPDEGHLVLIDVGKMVNQEDEVALPDYIPEHSPLLILPADSPAVNELNDLVLTSTFEGGLNTSTSALLSQLADGSGFYIDFLFINTKTKFESTKVSIEKIKQSICSSCMGKTHISVFSSENFAQGLNEYQSLKNGDLIAVEKYKLDAVFNGESIETPILFIP